MHGAGDPLDGENAGDSDAVTGGGGGDVNGAGEPVLDRSNTTIPDECCKYIRTKTMYYDFNRENALSIGLPCNTAYYWCVMSARSLGPDWDTVHPDTCRKGRNCYES